MRGHSPNQLQTCVDKAGVDRLRHEFETHGGGRPPGYRVENPLNKKEVNQFPGDLIIRFGGENASSTERSWASRSMTPDDKGQND